ncbi:hypothetical protein TNCV_4187441 [Trichonephila clavipes]|nr:hypothetical protein TNCV_4187441 [Trichonephila clavipes]
MVPHRADVQPLTIKFGELSHNGRSDNTGETKRCTCLGAGKRFDDIPDIQRNVTRLLNSIPKEDFLQSFQDMYSRSQWCIVSRGDYFEEQFQMSANPYDVQGEKLECIGLVQKYMDTRLMDLKSETEE